MSGAGREPVVLAVEAEGISGTLAQMELDARVVSLDGVEKVETYIAARPADVVLLPARVGEDRAEELKSLLRRTSPQGQVLRVDGSGRAVGLADQDPWRGADAPPPPPAGDLEDIVEDLADYARAGRLSGLVGGSETIASVVRTIVRVAPADVPVLIEGPSGTGKELVARGIHRVSRRHGHPFMAVNTPGLSESLIESELFGHEKGAFTGATARKAGVFEAAAQGTIFLDEIGDLSRTLQAKLLRVLEEGEFVRVGGTESQRVRARVLAATNVDLERAVEEGSFREDLYYRLKVVTIDIPPLRERPEDILPLMRHFVSTVCRAHDTTFMGFTEDAVAQLVQYPWPGNVRELRNLIEQVVLLHSSERITASRLARIFEERSRPGANLPAPTGRSPDQAEREMILRSLQALREEVAGLREGVERLASGEEPSGAAGGGPRRPGGSGEPLEGTVAVPLGTPLEEVELQLIQETLRRLDGDKRRTAETLGMGLRTLYRRLNKLEERETSREQEDPGPS
ncbi:MAG: sigma-54 dependent transcriptional regulator [bacterium]